MRHTDTVRALFEGEHPWHASRAIEMAVQDPASDHVIVTCACGEAVRISHERIRNDVRTVLQRWRDDWNAGS